MLWLVPHLDPNGSAGVPAVPATISVSEPKYNNKSNAIFICFDPNDIYLIYDLISPKEKIEWNQVAWNLTLLGC